ncbi:MAG: hypothetical protein R2828_29935 [Saprospiraceae bacterium]
MKTLILILTLFPTDTLPTKTTLLNTIDSFYQTQTTTQLLEFQTTKKGEWLKYLPTLGMTYTLDGKPRPTISFSSTILYHAKKDQQTLAAKRQAIVESNHLEAKKAKAKLEELLLEYETLQQEITARKEILDIDTQLFEIDTQQYENLEMAPSDFLKAKKAYLERQQSFNVLIQDLEKLEKVILGIY